MKAIKGGKYPKKSKKKSSPAIKYPELLVQLIQPYMETEPDLEDVEYLLNMGMIGWNLSVLKQKNLLIYKKYRKELFSAKDFTDASKKLVDKLVLAKEKALAKYDSIFSHVEIAETSKQEVRVNVTAVSYEEFIGNVLTVMKSK